MNLLPILLIATGLASFGFFTLEGTTHATLAGGIAIGLAIAGIITGAFQMIQNAPELPPDPRFTPPPEVIAESERRASLKGNIIDNHLGARLRAMGHELRCIAAGLSYDGTVTESRRKHRLMETAIRVEDMASEFPSGQMPAAQKPFNANDTARRQETGRYG